MLIEQDTARKKILKHRVHAEVIACRGSEILTRRCEAISERFDNDVDQINAQASVNGCRTGVRGPVTACVLGIALSDEIYIQPV